MTTSNLVAFLKQQNVNASFTDKLKITYRPYICPFSDILALIQPGEAIADIGCGSGQFALLAAEFTKPSRIAGIEISNTLINNARTLLANYPQVPNHFEYYDGTTFPEIVRGCDRYFMIDVLHHIPTVVQENFMRNLYQLMPSNSRLVLKDINGKSPFVLFNKMHDLIFAGEIGNELGLNQAISLLTKIGFSIETHTTKQLYVYPHYTIVAKK